jgi:hypothetical protein
LLYGIEFEKRCQPTRVPGPAIDRRVPVKPALAVNRKMETLLFMLTKKVFPVLFPGVPTF